MIKKKIIVREPNSVANDQEKNKVCEPKSVANDQVETASRKVSKMIKYNPPAEKCRKLSNKSQAAKKSRK
jgi:hypothetical protein